MTKALHNPVIYINQETNQAVLFMALELSNKKWKIAFSDGNKNRERNIDAGNTNDLMDQIQLTIEKLHLPDDVQIYSCYEAGRDGFWLHRWLVDKDITNYVIDSSSIEQSRKKRKAKTDRIDALKMVKQLSRYCLGDKEAFAVVMVPNNDAEDDMRLHRERQRLVNERGQHSNRIGSLLVRENIRDVPLGKGFDEAISKLCCWDGKPLGEDLQEELRRENVRYQLIDEQIKILEKLQKQRTAEAESGPLLMIKMMMKLKGVGWQSAWILVMEMFGWRTFKNRRQLAGFTGLTGTPFDSGDSSRDQGISKAGNRRVRRLLVELAWMWIRYQPQSKLAQWFERRFAHGGKRMRRVGIVAVARKLVIALWRFVTDGIVPAGAALKSA